MYNEAISRLNDLVGKKIRYIGRCLEIVWIGFGDTVIRKSLRGEEDFVAERSLHIQCPFRLIDENEIILGYDDLFTSNNKENPRVDLNIYNSTIFDTKCDYINSSDYIDKKVVDVKLSPFGDLSIRLENFEIQTFAADSNGEDEVWRLFKTGIDEEHLVVYSNRIDLE